MSPRGRRLSLVRIALLSFVSMAAGPMTAEEPGPKFANIILDNQGEHSIAGLHAFVDGARGRGLLDRMKITFMLNGAEPEKSPGEREFFRGLYDAGHEIGVEQCGTKDKIAAWLGIPAERITTYAAQMFADAEVEMENAANQAGFRASANVCVEGNSLAELWDIPHNWEGAPMFPYWAEWNLQNPLSAARVNREMAKDKAILELHWASRTLWHNYDRFPIPQCWHFGEPLKHSQWSVGQLVHRGEKGGWWLPELTQYENNLAAGRTPFLYLNTASEGCVFTQDGGWQTFVNPDEALECALDCTELLLNRGWKLVTVREFVDWYQQRWPCPAAPSMVYLMEDTLANRRDRDGRTIEGHGRLLHAETKHFQICDHENRAAPEMIVAYDLRTPNLLRNGYTFANPAKWNGPEGKTGHYASTTGNALFWGTSDALMAADGTSYFPPIRPPECKNRTFTFFLGDAWEPYQFVKCRFLDAGRDGEEIRWSKTMDTPVAGSDIRVIYHHRIQGPDHTVRIEVEGKDAVGLPARFRLSPYFHQGWDPPLPPEVRDPVVPDPKTAGQERHVFGRAAGQEFAFSESNEKRVTSAVALKSADGRPMQVELFNRNPGRPGGTCDDNPAMNRGLTLDIDEPAASVQFVDEPGPRQYVTAVVDLGRHTSGRTYSFTFRYWPGAPK